MNYPDAPTDKEWWIHETPTALYQPTEITNMSQPSPIASVSPIIERVTFVRGRNIKTMSEDEILKQIQQFDADHTQIEGLTGRSAALKKRADAIKDACTELLAELDSRAG